MYDTYSIDLPALPRDLRGLADALAVAGLGGVDVSLEGQTLRLTRQSPWTPADRATARNVVQAFAPPPRRRPRGRPAIVADLLALTAAERNRVLAYVCADYALSHPGFLAAIAAGFTEDEDDPAPGAAEPVKVKDKRKRKEKGT